MAIIGYKLRINGGSLVNQEVPVGLVYEYYFTGLDPETLYSVEIASIDELLEQSAWSSIVTATTDPTPALSMIVDEDGAAIVDEDGFALADYI